MVKKTFKQMVDEKRDLDEELLETSMEIADDLMDLDVVTAVKRVVAAPTRLVKSFLDEWF